MSANIAARFSPSLRAPSYSFFASAREASYLPWNIRLLEMPMNDGANCGFCSSAFRYWAMDSSNRPIFISSSAYESYGLGSSGISSMYFLNACSASG